MPSVYELAGDQCFCLVAVPDQGEQRLPVTEVGDQGCVVTTDVEFKANEYIDIQLEFADVGTESVFAHVVGSGEGKLSLRWLHFDPGEAQRLAAVLASFEKAHGLTAKEVAADAGDATKPKKEKKQTRRVVKPRSTASVQAIDVDSAASKPKSKTRRLTRPASADDVDALFPSDSPSSEIKSGSTETETITPFSGSKKIDGDKVAEDGKRQTRRVIKPQGKTDDDLSPSGAGEKAAALSGGAKVVDPPGEDSGGRHVVLEQTANFKKLQESDTERAAKPQAQQSGPQQTQTSRQTQTVRRNIRGDDGKLDVGASIRSRAKTVRASELAARHDKVRVLNMSTIKELIQDAVAEAIDRLGGTLDANEKKRLLEEAEEEFQERLKAFNAEKQGWAAQRKNLEGQLERASRLLEEERNKEIQADQFTVSDAGMRDLEKRFDRLLNAAISANGVNDVLAGELRGMVTRVLDEEREKIAEQARHAQSDAIAILEKKVNRLAGSLEESERERDKAKRRAAALEAAGGGVGGQAIFSDFEDEEDKQRKMELLKVVFEQNKEMREKLKQKGVVIKARNKPKPLPPPEAEKPAADAADAAADDQDRAEPTLQPAADADESPGDYDNLVDPDDMPWQPGTKVSTEVAGDNEDQSETGGIKKITVAQREPPPFIVNKTADADDEPAGDDEVAEEAYDDLIDPDDMPWQPGTKISTEVAGDNEDEGDDDDGGVKKISSYKEIEPPPITIRKAEG